MQNNDEMQKSNEVQNNDEMQKNGETKKSSEMQKYILFFLTGVLLFFMYSDYEADRQEQLEKLKKAKQQLQKTFAELDASHELLSHPAMKLVMNGTIKGYEKTTIVKAFAASFDDFKWDKVEGKKGETLVQFTGKISKEMHDYLVKRLSRFFDFERIEPDKIDNYNRRYVDVALSILGGGGNWRDSDYVKNLNQKYGYSFKKHDYDHGYDYISEKGIGNVQYYVEMFEDLKALLWKPGEMVKIQWLVYPNGWEFKLYDYETNAKGFGDMDIRHHFSEKENVFHDLLEAIYN